MTLTGLGPVTCRVVNWGSSAATVPAPAPQPHHGPGGVESKRGHPLDPDLEHRQLQPRILDQLVQVRRIQIQREHPFVALTLEAACTVARGGQAEEALTLFVTTFCIEAADLDRPDIVTLVRSRLDCRRVVLVRHVRVVDHH